MDWKKNFRTGMIPDGKDYEELIALAEKGKFNVGFFGEKLLNTQSQDEFMALWPQPEIPPPPIIPPPTYINYGPNWCVIDRFLVQWGQIGMAATELNINLPKPYLIGYSAQATKLNTSNSSVYARFTGNQSISVGNGGSFVLINWITFGVSP